MKKDTIYSIKRKFFIYELTTRRNFIPFLSIYFMTFPQNEIKMLWIFTWIWSILWFILEVPSWYFSDIFGHKKTLIVAKIWFLLSTVFFIIWWDWWIFMIGSILMAFGFAFESGAKSALLHETLSEFGHDNDFTKIESKMNGNVSLLSMLLIIIIPFSTEISYRMPFIFSLILDCVWLFISFSLFQPKKIIEEEKNQNIIQVAKSIKWTNIAVVMVFVAFMWWIFSSNNPFRWVYLTSLWYPVVLIGLVMWVSRLVWFWVSRFVHVIEQKLSIKQLFLIEAIVFSIWSWFMASLSNPYLIWLIISILSGYYRWRKSIISNYIIQNSNKKYKATIISLWALLATLWNFIFLMIFTFLVDVRWFRFSFAILSFVSIVTLLWTVFLFWHKLWNKKLSTYRKTTDFISSK